jgi:HK97 family phage portal protein
MLGRIFENRADFAATEERAISFQTIFAAGGNVEFTTDSGVVMNQLESLRVGTTYACIRLIADSISTLPVDTFLRSEGVRTPYRPRPIWLDEPESGVTRVEHFQQVLVSLLLDGNAFIRVLRDAQGVAGLAVLNPQHVEMARDPRTNRPVFILNSDKTYTQDEIIHITELRLPGELRGRSRIELVKEAMGLSKALETFASRFFGSGSTTSGIIEFPGNLTREQAQDLAFGFEQGHKGVRRSHKVGVLSGGASFKKTGVDNDAAQFIDARRFQVEEIARVFRCPPSMIQVIERGAMSYASVEQNGIQFVQHTLRPYIVKLEDAYNKLLPGAAFLRFNVEGLLRGDSQSRYAAHSAGLQAGFLSISDVRTMEDLPPIEGGDTYRVPLANVDLNAANLSEIDKKSVIAQRLIYSGFDPNSVMESLGLPAILHTGVPTTQLQQIAMIDAEDPKSAYDVTEPGA